jgi:hypothetical protein
MFDAFHQTPELFMEAYGFPKPRPEETIIFYCQYGARSLMAAQILSWMGYPKVMHFRDGYHEWSKQFNVLTRRLLEHDRTSGNNVRREAAFAAAMAVQREIAPEFNALPMKEASRYIVDESRSRGLLLCGEGLLKESLKQLDRLGADKDATPFIEPSITIPEFSKELSSISGVEITPRSIDPPRVPEE